MNNKKTLLVLQIVVVIIGLAAIVACVVGIRALKIAEKRPVSLEQIALRSNDIEFADDLTFAGERVPLEMFNIRERYERELLSTCYFHSNTMLLMKRSSRWFPVIVPILKKYGIPEDFKYLCVTESTLTNAVSPAGAVGFWQFLERTGKEYGLEINKDVDMRYNVELETEAACRYFLKSYEKYHNWTLVAASFNAGTTRLNKFLKTQKVNNYYDLLLPDETERYIFRILAFKTILENPEKYGIYVSKNLEYPDGYADADQCGRADHHRQLHPPYRHTHINRIFLPHREGIQFPALRQKRQAENHQPAQQHRGLFIALAA